MKVLVVADIYTHPHNQGNMQGVYRECLKMKELGWEVDYLYWGKLNRANLEEMEAFFGRDHLFYANVSNIDFHHYVRNYFRSILDKKGITKFIAIPYNPDELYHWEVYEKVRNLHKERHYDAIWLEYYLQSKVLELLEDDCLKVIHTHDMFSNRHKIFQRDGKIPEFYYLTPKGERTALGRADVIIAVQDGERDRFEELLRGTDTTCVTVGNLIEMRKAGFVANKAYGFIGSINDANISAVETYIDKILPIVKKRIPDSEFIIAGGVCSKIPNSKDYTKLGFIDALEDFYDRISFVVTPMLAGTGLNIKNVEALSFSKPIITTKIGAKGLTGAEDAIAVSTIDEFADMVEMLINNKEKLSIMRESAKEFVFHYNEKYENSYRLIEDMARKKSHGDKFNN